MQAYCIGVDPTLTEAQLAGLGERLALPEGWSYRTRLLDEELVVDTTATIATVVQDELENTYTLPPSEGSTGSGLPANRLAWNTAAVATSTLLVIT